MWTSGKDFCCCPRSSVKHGKLFRHTGRYTRLAGHEMFWTLSAALYIEHLTRAASKLVGHFKHRVVDNEALKKDKNKWNNPSINAVQHDGTRLSKCWKNWLKQDSLFQQYYPVSKLLRKKDTYLDLKTWPMDTCWGTC